MERSTVIGKKSRESRVGSRESERKTSISGFRLRTQDSRLKTQLGFSLLELMIAMFILIILLSVAIPVYQRSVQHAREVVLSENLWQMRRAIDQFHADKGKLPKGIDELVEAKYLREKPSDPITDKVEWDEVKGEDTSLPDGGSGMKDVKSLAEGDDSDGKAFNKY